MNISINNKGIRLVFTNKTKREYIVLVHSYINDIKERGTIENGFIESPYNDYDGKALSILDDYIKHINNNRLYIPFVPNTVLNSDNNYLYAFINTSLLNILLSEIFINTMLPQEDKWYLKEEK